MISLPSQIGFTLSEMIHCTITFVLAIPEGVILVVEIVSSFSFVTTYTG